MSFHRALFYLSLSHISGSPLYVFKSGNSDLEKGPLIFPPFHSFCVQMAFHGSATLVVTVSGVGEGTRVKAYQCDCSNTTAPHQQLQSLEIWTSLSMSRYLTQNVVLFRICASLPLYFTSHANGDRVTESRPMAVVMHSQLVIPISTSHPHTAVTCLCHMEHNFICVLTMV